MDDEKTIVDGLCVLIDWEKEGFCVVGTATDGESGAKLIEDTMADVVLTDIRMPLLSGHGLIDRVRKFNPDCKFIVISGYDNFQYAQDAVNRRAFCYLLKPIQIKELQENLAAIRKELDAKQRQRQMEQQMRQALPIVRERYLLDLAEDETLQPAQVLQKWDFLDLPYSLNSFAVMVMENDAPEQALCDDPRQKMLVHYQISRLTEDLSRQRKIGVSFRCARDRIALLCCEHDGQKLSSAQVRAFAAELQTTIADMLNETVSIGVGEVYGFPSLPCSSFEEAQKALQYKLLYGAGSLICFHELPEDTQPMIFPTQMEQQMLSCVEMGDADGAVETLRHVFEFLSGHCPAKPEIIYTICLDFVVAVSRCAILCGVPSTELGAYFGSTPQEMMRFKTMRELEAHVAEIIRTTTDQIHQLRAQKTKGTLGKIQSYIEKHYQEDLSLNTLSDMFFINASYLSQLFKKQIGCNFTDYLTGVRMENAKRLILDPEVRIYEVCAMVGYNNPRYFSQVFEKSTGFTPSNYRKQVLKDN